MTQDELNQLITSHELWLSSGANSGKRMHLENKNIEGLVFSGNLSYSTYYAVGLTDCAFSPGTSLESSVFEDCAIFRCTFVETVLTNIAMQHSSMFSVTMEDCIYSDTQEFRIYGSEIIDTAVYPEMGPKDGIRVAKGTIIKGGNLKPHPLYDRK